VLIRVQYVLDAWLAIEHDQTEGNEMKTMVDPIARCFDALVIVIVYISLTVSV
jgi:hypothetical protein